jgi:hypothetical protein
MPATSPQIYTDPHSSIKYKIEILAAYSCHTSCSCSRMVAHAILPGTTTSAQNLPRMLWKALHRSRKNAVWGASIHWLKICSCSRHARDPQGTKKCVVRFGRETGQFHFTAFCGRWLSVSVATGPETAAGGAGVTLEPPPRSSGANCQLSPASGCGEPRHTLASKRPQGSILAYRHPRHHTIPQPRQPAARSTGLPRVCEQDGGAQDERRDAAASPPSSNSIRLHTCCPCP